MRLAGCKCLSGMGYLSDRGGARTHDQRINLPPIGKSNPLTSSGLRISRPPLAHPVPTDTRPTLPPDLAAVIDAWPNLPEPIRAGILAMVKAASGREARL